MSRQFNPKRLSWKEVWSSAEDFRQQYVNPPDQLPVPIEQIVEFKLGIEIVSIPNLQSICDIDGFITRDLKIIAVDKKMYEEERYENRLRFTLAHEVGHLILHREEILEMDFRNTKDWKDFHLDQHDVAIEWFERQARQFAGRLLVPVNILGECIDELVDKIEAYRSKYPNSEELLITYIANQVCKQFGVSAEVIRRRIISEKIPY